MHGQALVGLAGCEGTFFIKTKMLLDLDHQLVESGSFVCLQEMRHAIFTQIGSRC